MRSQLHHVALNVADLEWNEAFFRDIFGMTVQRTAGERPKRQIWFCEGIQLNECAAVGMQGDVYDHVSLAVEDIPGTVERALAYGCVALPNGSHWFQLPDGARIELKPPF